MPAESLKHGLKQPHQPLGLSVIEQLDADGPAWRRRVAILMLVGLQAGPGGQGSVPELPVVLVVVLLGSCGLPRAAEWCHVANVSQDAGNRHSHPGPPPPN